MSRLNKISRELLFKYCTFSQAYRDVLASNPQYMQLISHWTANQKAKLKTLGFMEHKIKGFKAEVPPEVTNEIAFTQM